jgi:hypothetical protein
VQCQMNEAHTLALASKLNRSRIAVWRANCSDQIQQSSSHVRHLPFEREPIVSGKRVDLYIQSQEFGTVSLLKPKDFSHLNPPAMSATESNGDLHVMGPTELGIASQSVVWAEERKTPIRQPGPVKVSAAGADSSPSPSPALTPDWQTHATRYGTRQGCMDAHLSIRQMALRSISQQDTLWWVCEVESMIPWMALISGTVMMATPVYDSAAILNMPTRSQAG